MKRTLTTILSLALMSSVAAAECQPTYVSRWSYEYNSYMTYQGPDVCFYVNSNGQTIYQQPIVDMPPPPVYQQQGYYEDPYPNAGAALVGGLIGAGIGYAIGRNNNNGKKNNYYYYNNGHGNKHKKRYAYPGGWNNGEGRPQPKNNNNQGNND